MSILGRSPGQHFGRVHEATAMVLARDSEVLARDSEALTRAVTVLGWDPA